MTDPNGEIAFTTLVAIGAIAGAFLSAVVSLINGDSWGDVLINTLWGAVSGAAVVLDPTLGIVLSGIGLLTKFVDCLYAGMSLNDIMLVMGLSTVCELGLPSTDDQFTDAVVDTTFNVAKSVMCETGVTLAEENSNKRNVNPSTVTQIILMRLRSEPAESECHVQILNWKEG